MTRVKICGITSHDDLTATVAAGADAIGLTVDVTTDTPREIPANDAVELARATPPFVTTVLVTMPSAPEATVELASRVQPDVVQIHGDLTPGDLAYLSAKIHGDVLKATTPGEAAAYDTIADALLIDSLDADGAGGTGHTHNWQHTHDITDTLESPIILAGGLTPDNVTDAIDTVHPYGVDVASGVESSPGQKDPGAVTSFIDTVHTHPHHTTTEHH